MGFQIECIELTTDGSGEAFLDLGNREYNFLSFVTVVETAAQQKNNIFKESLTAIGGRLDWLQNDTRTRLRGRVTFAGLPPGLTFMVPCVVWYNN